MLSALSYLCWRERVTLQNEHLAKSSVQIAAKSCLLQNKEIFAIVFSMVRFPFSDKQLNFLESQTYIQ